MADWIDLAEELARWRGSGHVPTMWLRDDDARLSGPKLDHLIDLSARHCVPLHLAVVPSGLDPAMADRLRGESHVWTLQHGLAHLNHAPPGGPASEFASCRSIDAQVEDLQAGWRALQEVGLPRLLTALVPPWNHIADATINRLPALGYRLLSTCYARDAPRPVPGLLQVNIHVDPIRWHGGARFRGASGTLAAVVEHLAARRAGGVDADEPTGLLTHHAQTDAATWAFVERFMEHVADDVRWIRLEDLLRVG